MRPRLSFHTQAERAAAAEQMESLREQMRAMQARRSASNRFSSVQFSSVQFSPNMAIYLGAGAALQPSPARPPYLEKGASAFPAASELNCAELN